LEQAYTTQDMEQDQLILDRVARALHAKQHPPPPPPPPSPPNDPRVEDEDDIFADAGPYHPHSD
jgi:hypothetical protein